MRTADRLLVTGARGFLGSHIVARARAEGWEVVAPPRDSSADALDVRDPASVETVFSACRPTAVIHCAAYGVNYSDQAFEAALAVNVEGSLNVVTAAARHRVERLVHVGSCFEYGSKAGPIREDTVLAPTAVYGATKAAATLLVRERARMLGLDVVIARPFAMWGPGEAPHRLVPQIIHACLRRAPLELTSCELIRDFTYVEDMAAHLLCLALVRDVVPGTIVNLGAGRGIVLREFVLAIARLLGGETLMRFGALPYRPTEMPSLIANTARMRELLGERPATSLEEGVRRMLASMPRQV